MERERATQMQNKAESGKDPADVRLIQKFGRKLDTAQVWVGSALVTNPITFWAGAAILAWSPVDYIAKDKWVYWRTKKNQQSAERASQLHPQQVMVQEAQHSKRLLRILEPVRSRWNPQRSPQQLAQAA